MKLEMFINLDGNCREAAGFYAEVFKSQVNDLMTYGETPPDPNFPLNEADRDKIMYAAVPVGDINVMLMDMPSGSPLTVGDNITPTLTLSDKGEITRIFNALKEGGRVYMELSNAFFSELYGMVQDKFGVIWQILYDEN